jgi:hypothetical protein
MKIKLHGHLAVVQYSFALGVPSYSLSMSNAKLATLHGSYFLL